jgi:hypothetical protein
MLTEVSLNENKLKWGDEMETKTMPSGAVLEMTMAPFAEGHALLKAVSREIEGIKLDLKDVDPIKNFIARMIYSDSVERALKPCLDRCIYNKQRINDQLFEDPKSRGDYLAVVKEVLVHNLTPFIGNLSSMFKDITEVVSAQAPK